MIDFENRSTDTPPKWRAWLHIGMGVVYLLFGTMLFYVKKFGSINLTDGVVYGMSALLGLYGIFRLWRGITDLKEMNRQQ